jgi:xylan 1,4-beta-xylosidase
MRRVISGGRGLWLGWVCLLLCLLSIFQTRAEEPLLLEVDFARTNQPFRPLHGVNKGPEVAGGMFNVTEAQRQLGIPFTRLHDCHWPVPDVVDIHVVFPRVDADASSPASFDFARTDDYVAAVRQTGAKIIYRLGESIEHTRVKRFVHPPAALDHWADVCLGVIRHYNEGWAKGFRYDIQYWEIWNEPENRPSMWSGTDEDYLRLYKIAARKIKSACPKLKVGGPALGYSGQFKDGRFEPSAFLLAFLAMCKKESLPLDFLSWHCYTADLSELVQRSKAIRQLLDQHGFRQTESHLNEWNYLPNNSWKPLSKSAGPEARERCYGEMSGPAGASFIAAALLELQDAPIDVCNLFHGEVGGFGLFSENGVPAHNYYALRAFDALVNSGTRVWVQGALAGRLAAGAGISTTNAVLLFSNFSDEHSSCEVVLRNLPWGTEASFEARRIDAHSRWQPAEQGMAAGRLQIILKKNSVALVELRPKRGAQ